MPIPTFFANSANHPTISRIIDTIVADNNKILNITPTPASIEAVEKLHLCYLGLSDDEFTSKQFVQNFLQTFEQQYVTWLNQYNINSTGAFKMVDEQIGKALLSNAAVLSINPLSKTINCCNIWRNVSLCPGIQVWKKM
ncbi:MAG: hypothetical protein LBO69_06975 [Ignavibacteria bacterium]|jgi:hypothetical protein|nr:hypothetical protein [Ignavibacteria bacterium]